MPVPIDNVGHRARFADETGLRGIADRFPLLQPALLCAIPNRRRHLIGSVCASDVGLHHLGGIDDPVEGRLVDQPELQGRLFEGEIALLGVMSDL